MEDRTISTQKRPEEVAVDAALRPKYLADMIGQDQLRNNLGDPPGSGAKRTGGAGPYLLYGPPGLGKDQHGARPWPADGR